MNYARNATTTSTHHKLIPIQSVLTTTIDGGHNRTSKQSTTNTQQQQQCHENGANTANLSKTQGAVKKSNHAANAALYTSLDYDNQNNERNFQSFIGGKNKSGTVSSAGSSSSSATGGSLLSSSTLSSGLATGSGATSIGGSVTGGVLPLPSELPQEDEERLEKLFNRLDRDGNGRIDIHDLSEALREFGLSSVYAEVSNTINIHIDMIWN